MYRPQDQFVTPQHKTTSQRYIPKNRGSNLVEQVGSLEMHPLLTTVKSTDGGARGWWRGEIRYASLKQNGNGPMKFRVLPVNNYVQVQTTFTVQLPLLQLTYVKYMKVHDTKQQLQGFPIFRRGAK